MQRQILQFSQKKSTAVSLRDLYRFNEVADPQQRIRNAQFLHKELPIRIAQRSVELASLPYGLPKRNGIVEVRELFERCFTTCVNFPQPQTLDDDARYTIMLKEILHDHTQVVASMGLGLLETRRELGSSAEMNDRIDYWLNR